MTLRAPTDKGEGQKSTVGIGKGNGQERGSERKTGSELFLNVTPNEKNTQRRRKHRALHGCSKAEVKHLRPAADPFLGARNGQNLISWRWSLPSPTVLQAQFGEDRCTQFRVIVATDPQTNEHTKNKHTNRQGRLQYTVQLSAV